MKRETSKKETQSLALQQPWQRQQPPSFSQLQQQRRRQRRQQQALLFLLLEMKTIIRVSLEQLLPSSR